MANLPWLSETEDRLVESNLPRAYVQRFMEELRDHLEDLKEEDMGKEADLDTRLGEPEQIAETAVLEYRRRSFLGRSRIATFLVFAVSPLLAMVVAECVVFAAIFSIGGLFGPYENEIQIGLFAQSMLPKALILSATLLPSILLCAAYVWLARRAGIAKGWMLSSCVLLAMVAAFSFCKMTFSDVPGENSIEIGLGASTTNLIQLVQLIVPIAFGCWLIRKVSRPRQLASG